MHKATFLEATLNFSIAPDGPILIKAGETSGSDPARPDMEFIRTKRVMGDAQTASSSHGQGTLYIPGSSLKGVIRAQCERICRSLDKGGRNLEQDNPPLTDNPISDKGNYPKDDTDGQDDTVRKLMEYSSGAYINGIKEKIKDDPKRTAIIYRRSSFVSQMFGHTSLAARIRFADAYPTTPLQVEERNGVAIDRIYGSVAHGPFNYETVVAGTFATRITMKNITLAQLGLLGLALRDLGEGRIGIGFGKSRGLGRVTVMLHDLTLIYPTCQLKDDHIQLLHGQTVATTKQFVGIGAFVAGNKDYDNYHFPSQDTADLPIGLDYKNDDWMGVFVKAEGNDQITDVWKACMPAWKAKVQG